MRHTALLAVVLTASGIVPAQSIVPTPGTSRLAGRVIAANGKSPVRGATVLARHLSSGQAYTSGPTDGKGRFKIEGLPYGYHDIAVQADGLFVGEKVVNLDPSTKDSVVLTLVPGPVTGAPGSPGNEADPIGRADLRETLQGREFWRSPRGIAILGGIGGLALLILAGGSDGSTGENRASAPTP
jgi:hypothetical protein